MTDIKDLKAEQIHAELKKMVNKDVSYIDAVVEYANKHDIEIELLGDIIRKSVNLKEKLSIDAEQLNLIETEFKRLPVKK